MVIERNLYLNQLVSHRHNNMVKVITGIRRCGKSYLLSRLFKRFLLDEGIDDEHIIEMAFDDFENRQYRNPELFYDYVKKRINDGRMYYQSVINEPNPDDYCSRAERKNDEIK